VCFLGAHKSDNKSNTSPNRYYGFNYFLRSGGCSLSLWCTDFSIKGGEFGFVNYTQNKNKHKTDFLPSHKFSAGNIISFPSWFPFKRNKLSSFLLDEDSHIHFESLFNLNLHRRGYLGRDIVVVDFLVENLLSENILALQCQIITLHQREAKEKNRRKNTDTVQCRKSWKKTFGSPCLINPSFH
jgi:hypothetical protein